ncbi:MAG: glycosyltransferase [Pseudolabrys sp.]|jgi:chlorobactene glucosyltransferase
MEFILSAAWLGLAIWLISRAFRQRNGLPALAGAGSGAPAPAVAIIVPARNESANIGACLRALLAQDYPAERLHIIVADDNSTDDTAAIVASFAARDHRVTLVRTPPLPPGWKGKVHACRQGAECVAAGIEWLCFIDADMRAHPALIASAVAAADGGELDLLSLAPRHELESFAERLMIPCGLYLLAFSQDLTRIQAPDSPDVVAMGQFMLLRRTPYEAVGGHAAVCTAISEDVALARLLKKRGHRVLLEDGSRFLSGRMYTGWSTLWPGIAKNLTDMLGGPLSTVATAITGVVIAWTAVLLPLLDLYGCWHGSSFACWALAPALLGSAMAFALHLAGAVHFGIPFWYGFLFPIGYTAGAAMAFDSLRQRMTGRVQWKGRVYP